MTEQPARPVVHATNDEELRTLHNLIQDLRQQRAALESILLKTLYRVESILDSAHMDDGIVSVSALNRLAEYYDVTLQPMRDDLLAAERAKVAALIKERGVVGKGEDS